MDGTTDQQETRIPDGETWEPKAQTGAAAAKPKAGRNPIWNPANRRNSREWAFQMLFYADSNLPDGGIEELISSFWEAYQIDDDAPDKNLLAFTEKIVRGVWEHRDEIDARISSYLTNWTIDRIGGVDRSVLRMAMFELFFSEETPPVVILNEAVDVAKFFSTKDSGKFVNGVLDRALKDVKRAPRDANKPRWLRKDRNGK